jgi:hypothetical protein
MRNLFGASLLFLATTGGMEWGSRSCAAQETPSLFAGAGGGLAVVQALAGGEAWSPELLIGGRMVWSHRGYSHKLAVDAQPSLVEPSPRHRDIRRDFRAVYFMPSFAVGGRRSQFGIGLGGGLLFFEGEGEPAGTLVGFVSGAFWSFRVTGSYFLEFGARRFVNVNRVSANIMSLQLVKLWRL